MTLIGWGGIAMSWGSSGHNAEAFVRLVVGFLLAGAAKAEIIQQPYTLTSSNGVLNLLMVAQAETVPTLSPLNPPGLVYSVRLRPAESESCPLLPKKVIPYAGPLLKPRQGDVLNSRSFLRRFSGVSSDFEVLAFAGFGVSGAGYLANCAARWGVIPSPCQ
jgi:hypothetical protein